MKDKRGKVREMPVPVSALVPSLRFPEFRRAERWRMERMEKLYSFMRNNALSRDKLNYESGTAKNIHYGDIHTNGLSVKNISRE
jgi:type I restriction enzyme S subunit